LPKDDGLNIGGGGKPEPIDAFEEEI
jgi:hypothetical protein